MMQITSNIHFSRLALLAVLAQLLAFNVNADSFDRRAKDNQLWERHQKNSGKYFERQKGGNDRNDSQDERHRHKQKNDYNDGPREKRTGPRPDHYPATTDKQQTILNHTHTKTVVNPTYKVYNRYSFDYYRTPWYNTHYIAPVHYHYHPYGHRVRHLPRSYVRIVVQSVPYYYYSGMYFSSVGNEYIVVQAPVGAFVDTLPDGFIAFALGASTYFFVNDTYYLWDSQREGYAVVDKPRGADDAVKTATTGRLFAYPNIGQSEEQQARDRYDCHQWAVSETNVDPASQSIDITSHTSDKYKRAISACLEAKNYTVK